MCLLVVVFFFQTEDGIRDIGVTGVQTCALPIWIASCNGLKGWSGRPGSNRRPTAWKAETLPLSYSRALLVARYFNVPCWTLVVQMYPNGGSLHKSMHKVEKPLPKCTKSAFSPLHARFGSASGPPSLHTNFSKSTTARHVSGATCCM